MKQSLGQQLRALREAKNLSLREVETKTKVSNPYLSQLETGKIAKPSPHVLHKLAAAYDVGYKSLMELAGYLKTNESAADSKSLSGLALRKIGDLTPEEEKIVLAYVEFIKSQRKT